MAVARVSQSELGGTSKGGSKGGWQVEQKKQPGREPAIPVVLFHQNFRLPFNRLEWIARGANGPVAAKGRERHQGTRETKGEIKGKKQ